MKKSRLLLLLFILPFFLPAQRYYPDDFYGTIYIGEKKKTIEYSFLNEPVCGTSFACFNHLPTSDEYKENLKQQLVPFYQIQTIEFFKFNDEEKQLLQNNCPDCFLRKARITLREGNASPQQFIYLAIRQIDWKSSTDQGYEDLRTMESRFLKKIEINLKKK